MLKAHRRLSGSWSCNLEKQWGGPHHLSNLGPSDFLMVSLVKAVHVRLRRDFRWSQPLLLFSPSVVSDSATPWTEEPLASLSFTISWSLLKPWPLNQWCHPTISSCHPLLLLPSIFPSIRVFPNESALGIKWPKYWRFNFSVSPFTEYSGLISFRIDSLISLVSKGVSRVLRALSSKASILRLSVLPTLTSVHDYWKNHSFDYTGFCWQSDVSAF